MSRLLIVEDEAHLAEGLRFNLEAEGHAVQITDNGEAALKRLLKDHENFDALILDVMLPGKDGFTVARELRKAQNYTPLLMLTARGRPEDVLKGFESGADDYLPKPFNLAILIARIASLLRRKNWLNPRAAETEPDVAASPVPEIFRFDDKVVDFQNLQLRVGKQVVPLTMMESDRKSTRLNSSHMSISYAVFCLNLTRTTEISTLSLHDALPIYRTDCQPAAQEELAESSRSRNRAGCRRLACAGNLPV